MSTLTILDDFVGYHGPNVLACAKEYYPYDYEIVDNKEGNLNTSILRDTLKNAKSDCRVINVSFGASGGYCDSLGEGIRQTDTGTYDAMKIAFDKNISVCLPAGAPSGKDSRNSTEHHHEVSFLASSGFSVVVGDVKSWSCTHPGFVDYFIESCYNGGCGSSYSSPRIAGAIAKLQKENGNNLSQAQVRTAVENAGTYVNYNGDNLLVVNAYGIRNTQITDRLRAQAFFRVYLNRHPSELEIVETLELMRKQSLQSIALQFKQRKEVQPKYDRVTLQQRMCSLFHLWLNREMTNFEISISVDYLNRMHDRTRYYIPTFQVDYSGWYQEFLQYIKNKGEFVSPEFLF